jgi:outer membrane protein
MKKMKLQLFACGVVSLFVVSYAEAIDLAGVYNQALTSDPTYHVAEATWLSARQNLPLAMVGTGAPGTGLFPNLTAGGLLSKNYQKSSLAGANNQSYNDQEYTLTLTQPIFNLATWSSIRQAGFGVKSAYATYIAAGQDLINRVAQAYFEVLRANETLQYTIKEKEADKWELLTDLEKYKVGLTAITGVYNSQASYDQQISGEINNRTLLRDQAENLRVITGKLYTTFKQLPAILPVVVPEPANMAQWVAIAAKQSYAIKSAQMTLLQDKQAILTNLTGVAPTLNAVGNYNYDHYSQSFSTSSGGARITNKTGYVGLALDFPLVRGGFTWVTNKQARANYLQASDNLELIYANTINSTRQSYLSIVSGIAQIDADQQTIIANEKNLEATRAAYAVGTRTMVDVLTAIAQLYDAKKEWASARYDYVEALFQLKYNAGTLGPKDLETVNSWLTYELAMQYTQADYKKDPYYNAARIQTMKKPTEESRSNAQRTKQTDQARKIAQPKQPALPAPAITTNQSAQVVVSKAIELPTPSDLR